MNFFSSAPIVLKNLSWSALLQMCEFAVDEYCRARHGHDRKGQAAAPRRKLHCFFFLRLLYLHCSLFCCESVHRGKFFGVSLLESNTYWEKSEIFLFREFFFASLRDQMQRRFVTLLWLKRWLSNTTTAAKSIFKCLPFNATGNTPWESNSQNIGIVFFGWFAQLFSFFVFLSLQLQVEWSLIHRWRMEPIPENAYRRAVFKAIRKRSMKKFSIGIVLLNLAILLTYRCLLAVSSLCRISSIFFGKKKFDSLCKMKFCPFHTALSLHRPIWNFCNMSTIYSLSFMSEKVP